MPRFLPAIRAALRRSEFDDSWCAFLTNHLFITRSRLYREVKGIAGMAHGKVLDFGCGTTPYRSLFRNATEYVGLDYADSEYTRRWSQADVLYDGTTLPFEDGAFDWVCSFEVLTYLPDPVHSLRELRRVLKPGGQLFLTTAFMWEECDAPLDQYRFTVYALRRLLDEAGFADIRIRKIGHGWETGNQLLLRYLYSVLLPGYPRFRRLMGIGLTSAINAWTRVLGVVMPKTYDLYLNNIARATAGRTSVA